MASAGWKCVDGWVSPGGDNEAGGVDMLTGERQMLPRQTNRIDTPCFDIVGSERRADLEVRGRRAIVGEVATPDSGLAPKDRAHLGRARG